MTVLKETNVYRMISTQEQLGELCTWPLSVADGITGRRWHTDGPGIGSGARGPLGNRSIRWIRLSGARQRHKTGSIQMLSLPFSSSISILHDCYKPFFLLRRGKSFFWKELQEEATPLQQIYLWKPTSLFFLELSYPLQAQDKWTFLLHGAWRSIHDESNRKGGRELHRAFLYVGQGETLNSV